MSALNLALKGGEPIIPKGSLSPKWPHILASDKAAVVEAISKHDLTALTRDGAVSRLEHYWADYLGVNHCIAVSNGTDALALSLAAVGIEPGDEVIVPALSFMATALGPMQIGAVPIFVDIDPRTYNIDCAQIRAKITKRTKAIIPVHLHGLPAEMDDIMEISKQFGLSVVEDAAQSHGAIYKNRKVGTIGHIGTFSLNVSKNLPTCGEGGLITTNELSIAKRARRLRQFGEDLVPGKRRTYLHHTAGWNAKMCAPQAAFTLSQLDRFDDYAAKRSLNVKKLLSRLSKLPGLVSPSHPDDRNHVWHILRFRVDPKAAGFGEIAPGPFRKVLERALRAEGAPVQEYQRAPMPAQPIFQAPGNTLTQHFQENPDRLANEYDLNGYPSAFATIDASFTIQRVHLSPDASPFLEKIADAFEKVFNHLDEIALIAKATKYTSPWVETIEAGRLKELNRGCHDDT